VKLARCTIKSVNTLAERTNIRSFSSVSHREIPKTTNNNYNLAGENPDTININDSNHLTLNKDEINIRDALDPILNNSVFKSNDMIKIIFNNLINIIKENPVNEDTQLKIENYLINQYKFLADSKDADKISGIDVSLFNKELKEYCFSKRDDFDFYLDSLRESLNSNTKLDINKLVKSVDIHDYYIRQILNGLTNEEIISYIFYVLFLILTYNGMILDSDDLKEDEKTKIGFTSISMDLGKFLSNSYIVKLYKNIDKKTKSTQDYKSFKEEFLRTDKQHVLESSEFFLRLSGKIIDIMSTTGVIDIKVHSSLDRNLVVLKLSSELEKILSVNNSIAVLPMNLPMIVTPKEYSAENLGGFLLNNVEYVQHLIRPKPNYGIPSTIEVDNIIYKTINNMMKTPFKVNKDLLYYLMENNHIHKLLINSDYKHEYEDIKRNKIQEKKYQQFLSKKMLERYVLLIAHVYSNVPEIYFPIKLDNRGRLYPNVAFFNYQASELSKALIQFANPDTIKRCDINAIEYLKAYGASCYGNGLNRKSYTKRLEWVKEN